MELLTKKRNFAQQRSPTLNTVLMVEKFLQQKGEVLTFAELRRSLPKQVMHQTLLGILDYLEYSGKIVLDENKVLWTYKPQSKLKQKRGLRL
jgi:hypothetical protein